MTVGILKELCQEKLQLTLSDNKKCKHRFTQATVLYVDIM